MGPGSGRSGRNIVDPPVYQSDGDLQDWRNRVGKWVSLMKAAHDEGEDRTYKTLFKILGRTLYERALPGDQQALVDEAQAKGEINYLQTDDPVQAVRDIVRIVAVDAPIAMVTRLISSFQKVTSCQRKKNEDLRIFVSRFRGLAAKHLMSANASSSSQIGEVLAITLLNNANLEDGTLTNAKVALINLAEARAKDEGGVNTITLPKNYYETLVKLNARFNSVPKILPGDRDANELSTYHANFRSQCMELMGLLDKLMNDMKSTIVAERVTDSVANLFISEQNRTKLHLDDAVSVLRNLTETRKSSAQTFTMSEVQSMVERQVNQALLAANGPFRQDRNAGNRNPSASSNGKGNNNRRNKRSRDSSERNDDDVCFDCGDAGHRRRDLSCKSPSYLTKKRRSEQAERNTGDSDKDGKKKNSSFFRKGSSNGSGKKA